MRTKIAFKKRWGVYGCIWLFFSLGCGFLIENRSISTETSKGVTTTETPATVLERLPTPTLKATATLTPVPKISPTSTTTRNGASELTVLPSITPIFQKVTVQHLSQNQIQKLFLESTHPPSILYTEGEGYHPVLQSWFRLELLKGQPVPIEYPHASTLTHELRQQLELENSDDWFRYLRVSPSGSKVIYWKIAEGCKEPPCEYNLWLADADGTDAKIVTQFVSNNIKDITWLSNEKKILLALYSPYGDGLQNYLVNLERNSIIELDSDSEWFFPRPSVSSDECCLAGALYVFGPYWTPPNELLLWDINRERRQKYQLDMAMAYPLWSKDGQSLYILGQSGELYQFDVKDQKLSLLAQIGEQVENSDLPPSFFSNFDLEWLIFPEQETLVIGSPIGLWLVKWSEQ